MSTRTTLALKVVDGRNFTAQFDYLKVENPIFHVYCGFDPLNVGRGSSYGANYGVVGKSIPDF